MNEFRSCPKGVVRLAKRLCAALALFAGSAAAQDGIPTFQALEASGAVIGEIRILSQNIFDPANPRESGWFYRFGNALHVPTREGVIRNALLFRSGERVSARLIEETERLLRGYDYIYDVRIRAVGYRGGVVDIEVATRDSWSLTPMLRLSREGGVNYSGIGFQENNLLGSGVGIKYSRESDIDREGREFSIFNRQLFGTRAAIGYSRADYNDGRRDAFSVERPFYELDARWAAGLSATRHARIDPVYRGGAVAGRYRRRDESGELYGGWSAGLVEGWTRRYSAGIGYQYDAYRADPALTAPPRLPSDQRLVAPFFRYEVIEDGFRATRNLDRVERTEYLQLGSTLRLQLGRSVSGLGASRELWLYDAALGSGFALTPNQTLLTSAYARGRYGRGGGERQYLGASAKYYLRDARRGVFFASLSGDRLSNGDVTDQLLIGGDSGLRGYPSRYQGGTQRALLTLEQRFYTPWFPLRLFRVGAAVFFDHGRAWGGNANPANRGWLSDVGAGLRIFSDRSATGRVLHVDLAFPLNREPGVDSYQVLFKSKTSF
jgi:outer membrane protein assembly factor BamA